MKPMFDVTLMAAELLVLAGGVIEGFSTDRAFPFLTLQFVLMAVPPLVLAGFGAELLLPFLERLLAAEAYCHFCRSFRMPSQIGFDCIGAQA